MTDPLVEVVRARGHEHVSATHVSTFEVTTDDWLTPAGDCILAVEADRAPRDFSAAFRDACATTEATITATITVEGPSATHTETIVGHGDARLDLHAERTLVLRTRAYTDDARQITLRAQADSPPRDPDPLA